MGAVVEAELVHAVSDVAFNGAFTEDEGRGDVAVAMALGHQCGDFALTVSETIELVFGLLLRGEGGGGRLYLAGLLVELLGQKVSLREISGC